ncbi:MAG: type VI secretion system ImpA family N-terminal domain-containing protein, partial [Burkholderiaceae bacterium]|nr:type VI secretion system ImpA family N-terminal domain-containing protein [Burkholderiaceae bacterium]
MIDVDALALPLGDDAPAGPNLEYDGDFLALDTAARGKPEQQFGDTIVPAEEPDWKEIRRMSLALLERTRDLRVAGLLTRALCHTDGVAGFAQGVELLARLTCDHWEHVHPQLDPDDGNDPFMRMSALSMLADGEGMQRGEGILRDLRGAELVSARGMGACRMRDAELALELLEGSQETPTLSRNQIEGMFAEAARAGVPDHVGAALASVERLLAFLRDTV